AWATHFVAMIAYDPGQQVGFDLLHTFRSAAVGIVVSWGAFEVFDRFRTSAGRIAAGMLFGLAVVGLHYIGRAGVEAGGGAVWAVDLVGASFLFSCAFAVAGLHVFATFPSLRGKIAAGALLVLGIVSLHFTGVGALTFVPDASFHAPEQVMDRGGL